MGSSLAALLPRVSLNQARSPFCNDDPRPRPRMPSLEPRDRGSQGTLPIDCSPPTPLFSTLTCLFGCGSPPCMPCQPSQGRHRDTFACTSKQTQTRLEAPVLSLPSTEPGAAPTTVTFSSSSELLLSSSHPASSPAHNRHLSHRNTRRIHKPRSSLVAHPSIDELLITSLHCVLCTLPVESLTSSSLLS